MKNDGAIKWINTFSVKWENFKGFDSTDWIEIRPITILIGSNNSGKSTFIQPFLLLKQTLHSKQKNLPLRTKGEYVDVGEYRDFIRFHEVKKDIVFSLKIHRKNPKNIKQNTEVGTLPPRTLSVSFSLEEGENIVLKSISVLDPLGRVMLERTRSRDGKYDLKGIKLPSKRTKIGKVLSAAMENAKPTHFFFDADNLLADVVSTNISAKTITKAIEIPASATKYLMALGYVERNILDKIESIAYLGPVREYPSRLYEISGEVPLDVGVRGQSAPEVIFTQQQNGLIDKINEWISIFEIDAYLECRSFDRGLYCVEFLKRGSNGFSTNYLDMGFGVSQILPILVQGYISGQDELIIIEQPEIHLNPKQQSRLADLFLNFAKDGKGVLIETHSEHLLLRLRRLIAEGKLPADQVALYFVENDNSLSSIRRIPIDEDGHIDHEEWPEGFFEDSLREALDLARAQVAE